MNHLLSSAVCAWALLSSAPVRAAAPERTSFPVIVVFKEDVSFEAFRGLYQPDVRAVANRQAWDYIDAGVGGAVQALELAHGFKSDHVYSAALSGFAARLPAAVIDRLERDPRVAYVEQDGPVRTFAQTVPYGIIKTGANASSTHAGDGTGTVSNVNVYVIDTGVDGHADLNLVNHVNFTGLLGGGNTDCHGHGTHVAGSIAAKDNTSDVVGVVPGAPITGVKVLDCLGMGSNSNVIKGVDWVTANARKPAVANMSLGGGANTALDDAVRRSAASGVFYALAAGNDGADACGSSPARAGAGTNNGVLTVAATDSADAEASFSNYGSCVDIWAPGVDVLSTRDGGGTTTMSGTSMASPHGAGGGALYLRGQPSASPSAVEAALKASAQSTGSSSKDGRPVLREYVGNY
jgi:subtilisin family serine protease